MVPREAEFTYTKRKFNGYFRGHGFVKDEDQKYIIWEDNDGFQYLVDKKNFRYI